MVRTGTGEVSSGPLRPLISRRFKRHALDSLVLGCRHSCIDCHALHALVFGCLEGRVGCHTLHLGVRRCFGGDMRGGSARHRIREEAVGDCTAKHCIVAGLRCARRRLPLAGAVAKDVVDIKQRSIAWCDDTRS